MLKPLRAAANAGRGRNCAEVRVQCVQNDVPLGRRPERPEVNPLLGQSNIHLLIVN